MPDNTQEEYDAKIKARDEKIDTLNKLLDDNMPNPKYIKSFDKKLVKNEQRDSQDEKTTYGFDLYIKSEFRFSHTNHPEYLHMQLLKEHTPLSTVKKSYNMWNSRDKIIFLSDRYPNYNLSLSTGDVSDDDIIKLEIKSGEISYMQAINLFHVIGEYIKFSELTNQEQQEKIKQETVNKNNTNDMNNSEDKDHNKGYITVNQLLR